MTVMLAASQEWVDHFLKKGNLSAFEEEIIRAP
jgi:hypothetical protein